MGDRISSSSTLTRVRDSHHLVVPDDLDGGVLLAARLVAHAHHVTEHALTREARHRVALVQQLAHPRPETRASRH